MNRRFIMLGALACLVSSMGIAAEKPLSLDPNDYGLTVVVGGKNHPIYRYHKPTRTLIPIPRPRPYMENFEQ